MGSAKRILMSGNEAMAEAAIRAGCRFYAGYPITPQNELIAYMARQMCSAGTFIQAESELAAINMVFGAAAAGVRAMTSSSSPGISLKQEGISYLAGCELPAVIINVMRAGPGLGNIHSSQSDYFQATRGGGHGDYFTPVFSPASVEEAAQLVMLAFDVSDYYRTPVLILTDAIIGQMMEAVSFPSGSSFSKEPEIKTWALTGAQNRAPNLVCSLFLGEGVLSAHNEKLRLKWERIKKEEQRSEEYRTEDMRYLVVAYGSQARIVRETVDTLREENVKIGLLRPVSLWPFPQDRLSAAAAAVEKVFVIEQSLGQMVEDVRLSLPGKPVYFFGYAGGRIPRAEEAAAFIKKNL